MAETSVRSEEPQDNSEPKAGGTAPLPIALDFGGPIGNGGFVPPYLQNRPRRDTAINNPPPSNPFGHKPPDYPSLF